MKKLIWNKIEVTTDWTSPESLRSVAGCLEDIIDSGRYEEIEFGEDNNYYGARRETDKEYESRIKAENDLYERSLKQKTEENNLVAKVLAIHPELEHSFSPPISRIFDLHQEEVRQEISKSMTQPIRKILYDNPVINGVAISGYFYEKGTPKLVSGDFEV